MKVALTGVTGHLGAAVVRTLIAEGHQVNVLVRGNDDRSYRGLNVQVFAGNILHSDSLVPFLRNTDALIHCAGVISIDGDRTGKVTNTNVEGTRHVLQLAASCGVRRTIHISSIHVYEQLPVDETLDELRGYCSHPSAYDMSKQQGEEIALSFQQANMEVLVMQPTGLIGPYDFKPSRTGKTILSVMRGRMPFMIDAGFDFCDSRDVAKAIVSGLQKGRGGEKYILSGRWTGMPEIIRILADIKGKRLPVMSVPLRVARSIVPFASAWNRITNSEAIFTRESLNTVMSGNTKISAAKAHRELEYHSRPLTETLQDTVHWFQSEGYLRK